MAELATSMVVGPLLSLVKNKASNYLLEQYNVMEGMEKHHKILKRKLPAILDIMADAEKLASHREGVKAWLEELKTVAYEANDIFDEFQYEALRRKAKEEGHITKLGIMAGVKLFPTHNRLAFRLRMGNKLNAIVEIIEVLMAEMNTFGFKHQIEAPKARMEGRETDHNINDPEGIVLRSRDEDRQKIVDILLDGQSCCNGDLLVVPIVGMGGMGKTTLAQLIYNDQQVQEHFQPLSWVRVPDDFDVRPLANKICKALEKSHDSDMHQNTSEESHDSDMPQNTSKKSHDSDMRHNTSEESLSLEEALKMIQYLLKGKRYLLVLDDIWKMDNDKWQKLKACLKDSGVGGSAIITTTRDKKK